MPPQEKIDSKLVLELRQLVGGFNRRLIDEDDFEAKMKRVLALVQRLIQNNTKVAERAEAKADTALKVISEKHSTSLSDLKNQTNQLFVGKRLNEITEGNTTQFQALQSLLDDKIASVKDGNDGKTATNEELLALMLPLLPKSINLGDVEKAIKALQEEHKKIRDAIKKAAGNVSGRIIAGPNANAWNIHIVSNQCTGENRIFTMPMARKVYKFEMSQHPFNLYEDASDETHGFTLGDRSLVLNKAAPAPERGQSAAIYYLK